ncbi:MAG: hypothetical protein QXI17_01025, partial [Candidatus Bilamarchaeaceae archaeon]
YAVRPGGAFYAFIKVQKKKWKNDWEFVRELLRKGVVVVPGSASGPMEGIYFRLVFLPSIEELNLAFDKIAEVMRK